MRRPLHLLPWAMQSTPGVWEFAAPHPVLAASICSMDSTTLSAICSPCSPLPGHTFHDLIGMDYQQDVDLDKLYMDVRYSTSASWALRTPSTWSTWPCEPHTHATGSRTSAFPKIFRSGKSATSIAAMPMSRNTAATGVCRPPRNQQPSLIQQAADIINKGSRVTIFVGRGRIGCTRRS